MGRKSGLTKTDTPREADFLAEAFVLFLNVLMRTRHQVFMPMLLHPLIQRRKTNTQPLRALLRNTLPGSDQMIPEAV
jgi:hypothetical protein